MRKRTLTMLSCILAVFLFVGATTAFAASSPNYATNSHEDMSLYYYGYVQCQPSYIEDGNHAARGYIRYQRPDLFGNIVEDTGRLYTAYGTGPNDSRILSRSYTFTDSIIPNPNKTQFWYGFDWVPSGSGAWPVSISGNTVTE